MSEWQREAEAAREPVLSPVDRVSELLFGLFMALTFVGAVSVAEAGTRRDPQDVHRGAGLQPRLGPRRRGHVFGAHGHRSRQGRSRSSARSARRGRGYRAQADRGVRLSRGRGGSRLGRRRSRQSAGESSRVPSTAGATDAAAGTTCSRPLAHLPDRGRIDVSRRAALPADPGCRHGQDLFRAPSRWRCCFSAGLPSGVSRATAVGRPDC